MTSILNRLILALVAAVTVTAFSNTAAMAFGRVHAPLGYQLMCLKDPGECSGGGPAQVNADWDIMAKLRRVNNTVNASMRPVHDGAVDVWTADAKQGDCEEFALAKRERLIREGVPASSLRLAYVKTSWGEGHAVLVVETNRGQFVLDVLTHKILPLSQTRLRVMSMATADPNVWS